MERLGEGLKWCDPTVNRGWYHPVGAARMNATTLSTDATTCSRTLTVQGKKNLYRFLLGRRSNGGASKCG